MRKTVTCIKLTVYDDGTITCWLYYDEGSSIRFYPAITLSTYQRLVRWQIKFLTQKEGE